MAERFDLAAFVAARPPRAAGFIVTLYGDAVVPRGGELGMGSIIAACALVGISETLVRTAVSRLVAAGRLGGQKLGRRSFYRLTEEARAEFEAASRLIYGPPEPCGWRLLILEDEAIAGLERAGYARLRPGVALGPDREAPPSGAFVLDCAGAGDAASLRELAAQLWGLERHAAALEAVHERFVPLRGIAADLPGEVAMGLRLLLVHDFRHALLADPRLPASALPPDWPASRVRALFVQLYQALSPQADAWIAREFTGSGPVFPVQSPALAARMQLLDMSQ